MRTLLPRKMLRKLEPISTFGCQPNLLSFVHGHHFYQLFLDMAQFDKDNNDNKSTTSRESEEEEDQDVARGKYQENMLVEVTSTENNSRRENKSVRQELKQENQRPPRCSAIVVKLETLNDMLHIRNH